MCKRIFESPAFIFLEVSAPSVEEICLSTNISAREKLET